MKTLSEVIACFEKACDLEKRCEGCDGCLSQENGCPNDGADAVPDALHYLKEYHSLKIREEHLPIGTLRFKALIPAKEWDKGAESLMLAQIEADLQIKVDEILRNYEQAYGLEPVTIREALPYLKGPNYMVIQPSEEQMRVRGYKIYKKRAL